MLTVLELPNYECSNFIGIDVKTTKLVKTESLLIPVCLKGSSPEKTSALPQKLSPSLAQALRTKGSHVDHLEIVFCVLPTTTEGSTFSLCAQGHSENIPVDVAA